MRRVLFHWRGRPVHAYPVLLYCGLLVGLAAGRQAARALDLAAERVLVAQLVLIPLALAGARLLHVLLHLRLYRAAPGRIVRMDEGGADMFGGLPVALLASLPLAAGLDLPLGRFWDATTFTLFAGMAVVRCGCLLNGCCGGRETASRWGLRLPDPAGVVRRRVPMQLVEIGGALGVLALAAALAGLSPPPGTLFLGGVAAYSLGRTALDPWRAERSPGPGRLTAHQGIYAATLALCALGIALAWTTG